MKKISTLFAAILTIASALPCLNSCSGNPTEQSDTALQQQITRQLIELYTSYADTMEMYTDSVSIDSISKIFDHRIAEFYANYSIEVDASLSESQNDSIWKAAQRYIKLRNSIYAPAEKPDSLGVDPEIQPDTIENGSV